MANTLSKTGITNGQTIQPSHVTQSIDAFTGTEAYDISLSGSLTLTGNQSVTGSLIVSNSITSSKLTSDDGTLFLGYAGSNNITIENGGDLFINSVGGAIDIESDDRIYIGGDAVISGSSTVSGSLTVSLPIPGKDNYNFDVSTGFTYTNIPFAGIDITGSGLIAVSEENNLGQVIMTNSSDVTVSGPALVGASFPQSVGGFQLKSGSIECYMNILSQDLTVLGGEKQILATMAINPDGTFTGNRTSTVDILPEGARMRYSDASGQQVSAKVTIDEFNWAGMQIDTPISSSTTSSFRVYNEADDQIIFDVYTNGMVILSPFSASDDADAATKGIPTGGLYHTNGTVKIRLS